MEFTKLKLYSSFSLAFSVYFAFSIIYAHIIRDDLDFLRHTLSYYALGEKGLVQTIGFFPQGIVGVTYHFQGWNLFHGKTLVPVKSESLL